MVSWWLFFEAEEAGDWLSFKYCSCAGHFHLSANFLVLMASIGLYDVKPKDHFLILLFRLVS